MLKKYTAEENDEKVEGLNTIQNWLYTLIILASIGSILILYMFLKGTLYESHFFEWLNLTVRLDSHYLWYCLDWSIFLFCFS